MDCLAQDSGRVNLIWDLWDQILAGECKHPIRHLLGNHDVWGWDKKKSKTTGSEPGYGKAFALKRLGLQNPYYSFDQAGWHFIGLDSIQPHLDSYRAGLDAAQFDWLRSDLSSVDPKMPVILFSHVPIISAAIYMKPDIDTPDGFSIPGSKVIQNNVQIKDLLKQHPNVKLCVSGHIHLRDAIEYMGVTYLCNGAVCGDYWKNSSAGECEPGYCLIDLFEEGRFTYDYIPYGWVFHC